MITLSTPPQVNSVLGGNAPISYNKLVLSSMTLDPVTKSVIATVGLRSTTNPEKKELSGKLVITTGGLLTLEVTTIGFSQQVQLTAPQITSVGTIVTDAQNSLESGLVSLGVVAGVQAAGA